MEQKFLLQGLDCPHCAEKIRLGVAALPGVKDARVNLMQQTLTVQGQVSPGAVAELVRRFEPEVQVSPVRRVEKAPIHDKPMLVRLAVSGVLFALGMVPMPKAVSLGIFLAAYCAAGYDIVLRAIKNIGKGQIFDENFLMSVASLGALALGQYHEAVAVMLFYQVGEYFQAMSVRRSRRSIDALLDIRPDTAQVLRDGKAVTVDARTVCVGDVILIAPGERVSLDGTVLSGTSALDTAALTGESMPRYVRPGEQVLSGCINGSGALTVQVTKAFHEGTASRIIALVENAGEKKAPAENFITAFARWYTPAVVLSAAALALIPPLFVGNWLGWISRGLVFLVVSCPCALVISVPLAFFAGIGAASRQGILIKGSNYLEALAKLDTVVFDKTGTLTQGVFQVQQVLCAPGYTRQQILTLAATAEQGSTHPIARSILACCDREVPPAQIREIPGQGITAVTENAQILCGSERLLAGIPFVPCHAPGTRVYVAENGVYAGCIVIADKVRSDSKSAVAALKKLGIRRTVLLTGDSPESARAVSRMLALDHFHANLLPGDKVAQVEALKATLPKGKTLAFVGDGINDAPVLARADVGIAMGGLGADAAIEAADVVLMTDEPGKAARAIQIARQTKAVVTQNIVLALGVKALVLLTGALGLTGMWAAVFADVGVAVLAVLSAMGRVR